MSFWHQAPFVRLLLPLTSGIITAAFVPVIVPYSLPVILFLFAVLIFLSFSSYFHLKYVFRWLYGAVLSVLLFSLGYAITINNTEILYPDHFSKIFRQGDKIIAEVAESMVAKERTFKTVLEARTLVRNGRHINTNGRIIAYFQKDSISENIRYGNVILFKAPFTEISPPGNPEEFNYKRFLSFHRVYHQAYLKMPYYRILDNSPRFSIIGIAERCRNYLMNVFKSHGISGDEYTVASALMLGSREEIDKDLVQAYASSGALHVLSVSGLHVGVIFMVMTYMLVFLDKVKYGNVIKTVLLLAGLWFYAVLTGLTPSVVRAATMFSFVVAGKAGKQNTNIYNILSCSAFFLLLIDPFLIMEVGFQLSYLAVLGIVFIQPLLSRQWEPYIPAAGRFINWLITQIWMITTVSIGAQAATFALGLLYFHQFPNYFLFSNLVVIPLSTLVIYSGILLFAVSPLEYIAEYVAVVFKGFLILMNESVLYVEKLPFSLLQGISISLWETWLIYAVMALALAFIVLQNIKFVKTAFIILVFLLFYQLAENHFQHNQKKFVVYNIGKSSACDFIDGKKNYFLADTSLVNDESRMLFHIRHHWWELGLDKSLWLNTHVENSVKENNLFLKGNFAQFHDKRILFINGYFPLTKNAGKIKWDYIVISGSPKITLRELTELFDFDTIIIDGSNTSFFTRKMQREARSAEVNCYSVSESGAFIADL